MNPARTCTLTRGRSCVLWLLLAVVATAVSLPNAYSDDSAAPNGSGLSFNRDIRPILSENCFFCHGPDAATCEADLRLDLRADAIAAAIVPGDPEASELVARIFSDDPDMVMPPRHSARGLSAEQKATLRQWVLEGAAVSVALVVRAAGTTGSTCCRRFSWGQ